MWYCMDMKMISAAHGVRCRWGCCGTLPAAKFLGNHQTETGKRAKRALKKKDRQAGKAECEK